jgi:hypothetical protein
MTFCPFTNRIPYGFLSVEEKKILKAEGPWEIYTGDLESTWKQLCDPLWLPTTTYRRKKVPVIDKKEIFCQPKFGGYYFNDHKYPVHTHKITYNIVDGEVDVFSCVMEKL